MKVCISPEAQNDLQGIKNYIAMELDHPMAALDTVSKIVEAVCRLKGFPDSGAPLSAILDMKTDYRFLVSDSYLVFYRHEGESIYVVRILYGRRDYMRILFGEQQKDEPNF
ncbi:MAG TPA: type II toxin-antitoxin system RelE/ParE family toxin [Methylomusa anaerophila]|uniref:Plasmid stabilisation system protein n=1 Tax=Methylomusa anaerophila TaxID=1930071 RepID=A0A348AL73_9FIRM|nr:type II toxin-antitoxin system RelE/ParE family toxin [Methylomusa anaerophila]BBB91821.1 plasmid stabilisation system protein [Methylomusa anaerophila]HML88446.1 type II toxin-antitoxin system RelE/ParE family toxin [Methylomusa anaerophila]